MFVDSLLTVLAVVGAGIVLAVLVKLEAFGASFQQSHRSKKIKSEADEIGLSSAAGSNILAEQFLNELKTLHRAQNPWRIQNTVWGNHQGINVMSLDLTTKNHKNQTINNSVHAAEIELQACHVTIESHAYFEIVLRRRFDKNIVATGNKKFDRKFFVKRHNAMPVDHLLTPQLLQFLIDSPNGVRVVEIIGDKLVLMPMSNLTHLNNFDTAVDFIAGLAPLIGLQSQPI